MSIFLFFFVFYHFSFISVTLIHFVGLILDIFIELQRRLLLDDMFINVCTSIMIRHFLILD